LCEGPDGALYIADLYRGLIQHRLFVTSFLRKQVLERGLEQPLHHGRIWRVRAAGQALTHPGALSQWDAPQLVRALESESGWVRDTAQRLLVEDFAESAAAHAGLRQLFKDSASQHARVHALRALQGMGGLRSETALAALSDASPWVRATALRVSATLAGTRPEIFARWQALRGDADPLVREALVLALGDLPSAAGGKLLGELLWQHAGDALLSTAALSGLFGRELEVLQGWPHAELASAQAEQVSALIRCIAREGRSERLLATLELWSERAHWRTAIESGWKQAPRRGTGAIALAIDPRFASDDPRRAYFRVPDEADTAAVRPLTPREMLAFERGRELYAQTCAACHLPSGSGSPGIAPALVDSPWVLEDPARAIRILLHGLRGEITVDGERFDADMPAFSASDEDLAAVLTYIRREWGNHAEPVGGEQVRVQRGLHNARTRAWTVPELK
jgi:mono/diheme cytochrome c family protein